MGNWPEFIQRHFSTLPFFQFMEATVVHALNEKSGYRNIRQLPGIIQDKTPGPETERANRTMLVGESHPTARDPGRNAGCQ
ncbi:MAG: hypothetical protein AB9917_18330 [Negativicutes bacterium]